MRADRLDDLRADAVQRVQRGERVLEDHRDLVAAQRAQVPLGERQQVAPLEQMRPLTVAPSAARQPEHGSARTTVLPEPDSPTIPSVRPGSSS